MGCAVPSATPEGCAGGRWAGPLEVVTVPLVASGHDEIVPVRYSSRGLHAVRQRARGPAPPRGTLPAGILTRRKCGAPSKRWDTLEVDDDGPDIARGGNPPLPPATTPAAPARGGASAVGRPGDVVCRSPGRRLESALPDRPASPDTADGALHRAVPRRVGTIGFVGPWSNVDRASRRMPWDS